MKNRNEAYLASYCLLLSLLCAVHLCTSFLSHWCSLSLILSLFLTLSHAFSVFLILSLSDFLSPSFSLSVSLSGTHTHTYTLAYTFTSFYLAFTKDAKDATKQNKAQGGLERQGPTGEVSKSMASFVNVAKQLPRQKASEHKTVVDKKNNCCGIF